MNPLKYLGLPVDDRLVVDRVTQAGVEHVHYQIRAYVSLLLSGFCGQHIDLNEHTNDGSIPFAVVEGGDADECEEEPDHVVLDSSWQPGREPETS
ncbi:hypothetical protein [Stomatohabitans albus]|uniref:hypothetical protein n=1 Tax=Stomatohabitans albus TaxID=3110766 RepID=UPI00300D26DD